MCRGDARTARQSVNFPTSHARLLVKAKAVKVIHCDEDEIDIGDATNHRLASSLLNDMLAGFIAV